MPTPIAHDERILITVKTYPTPSRQSIEVSCTAGVTSKGDFIRIFPVPFRYLDGEQQFSKYQEIKGRLWTSGDHRPESHKIDPDSIEVLGPPLSTANHWEERRKRIQHLEGCCMCCLQKEQKANGSPTLGFFKPHRIDSLELQTISPEWSAHESAKLSQESLWSKEELSRLEKVPFKFKYHFSCPHAECPTHSQSCTDWEIGESFRQWRRKYGGDWEQKFRQKYEDDVIGKFDTHFFAGTVHQHPNSWMIVGLWYPLRAEANADRDHQLPLF